MKQSVSLFLVDSPGPFARRLREWWALKNQGLAPADEIFTSHFQKAFAHLIECGCAGQPTLEYLQQLESEIESAAQAELELFVATLPFKVLIPMLLFQFPAYLLLLLGPVLRELTQQIGG
jgi:hypothetical protein